LLFEKGWWLMTEFWRGLVVGIIVCLVVGVFVLMFRFCSERDKKIIEEWEKQNEVQLLREDIINRDPAEFFEIPGVRGAADGAAAEFDRKRNEAVQRFRGRNFD
jgi:hypothetical protein